MRYMFILSFVAAGLSGCGFSGTFLEPPTSSASAHGMNADINAFLSEAAAPGVLTASERALVAGRETARFFMAGRAVVTPEGKPALHSSVLPQLSNEAADRYAVCLLKRGYTWQTK